MRSSNGPDGLDGSLGGRPLLGWAAGVATATLAAAFTVGCGGGGEDVLADPAEAHAGRAIQESPLLDDEGQPMPPVSEALPDDPEARTRAGLYATAVAARRLERSLGSDVVRIDASCCPDGSGLPEFERSNPGSVILVEGSDARRSAQLADALIARGHARVFVVVAGS